MVGRYKNYLGEIFDVEKVATDYGTGEEMVVFSRSLMPEKSLVSDVSTFNSKISVDGRKGIDMFSKVVHEFRCTTNDKQHNKWYKWDMRFLALAKEISGWSEGKSGAVGAVVIGDSKNVLSIGYNNPPNGADEVYNDADEDGKNSLGIHAEMNAIYNASNSGVCLDGSTLYVFGSQICLDCAKGIIQAGVKNVVIQNPNGSNESIDKSISSSVLFLNGQIEYRKY